MHSDVKYATTLLQLPSGIKCQEQVKICTKAVTRIKGGRQFPVT